MASRRRHTLAQVLGPLEAEVMDIVWDREEVTVRDVYKALKKVRPIAYTTVMTTMSRLAEKRVLHRNEDHAAHRYSPLVSKEQYAESTVKSVVDWLVTQFPRPAVAYFLDRVEREDEQVIERLVEAIKQREGKRRRD